MKEEKIVKGIKGRDERALKIFIDEYGPIIKGVIVKTIPKFNYLWGEVLNDTTLEIWEEIDNFNPSKGSLKSFSCRIAKYKSIDALRKEVRHNHDTLDIEPAYYEHFNSKISKEEIDLILANLSTEDQEIFKLLFLEDLDYEEVSHETGLSKDALYARVSRGRKKLKKNLKGGQDEIL